MTGEVYTRRADLVGCVNGIPLVFIELKASHKRLKNAYDDNLRDYRATIPHLFWYNAFVILSNGSDSRIGTVTSEWEHFAEWKKIDLVENFTLFCAVTGGTAKILAKNHQFHGVNNAMRQFRDIQARQGRLGVFWHTQGSGKSYSMIFFAQKVLRQIPGNHTFVILTDRLELDEQIYGNFASAGAVTEPEDEVRADSGEHLKRLLGESHR